MNEEHVLDDRVLQALQTLAENDRASEAPPEVEARLLDAFHARRARRVRRQRAWMGVVTLAAGIVIALLLWPDRTPKPLVSAVQPVLQIPETARAAPAPAAAVAPSVTPAPRKVVRKIAAVPQPHEVVTDFFPLMNPAPSFERGQMLRVQLPAAAMQTVGLPVREDHLDDLVQADVLVGEEGMPRAIRFVRFDVK
jgi:hypothetical protein